MKLIDVIGAKAARNISRQDLEIFVTTSGIISFNEHATTYILSLRQDSELFRKS